MVGFACYMCADYYQLVVPRYACPREIASARRERERRPRANEIRETTDRPLSPSIRRPRARNAKLNCFQQNCKTTPNHAGIDEKRTQEVGFGRQ